MSHYIHHVPGRLRVRSKSFRCSPGQVELLGRLLTATDGVLDVKVNNRNGSITVQYDPDSEAQAAVMRTLAEAGCLPAASHPPSQGPHASMTSTFSKAVITAIAQQTVVRSLSSLATVLR